MPSILFLHENYPAQFGNLAARLAKKGWQVVYATQKEEVPEGKAQILNSGVRLVRYSRARDPRDDGHPYLRGTETAVLNGQAFARKGSALVKAGFNPDVIVAHSGWGSGSFAKVIWPNAKFVQYLEWWYSYPPVDVPIEDQADWVPEDKHARTLVRNLPFFLDFQQTDLVIAPTGFQADQCPDFVRDKLIVQHDGIDCDLFRPLANGEDPLPIEGVPEGAPIVTYATRGMEPTRGFPTFMEAVEKLLKRRPDIHVVVAGRDSVHYGPKPKTHASWKEKALAELDLDMDRLHFIGLLPKVDYARLLRRSAAHVYLTQPFVLSWSMIETMATGAPIVASDVDPVREVLHGADCARLVAPKDVEAVCREVESLLDAPEAAKEMGAKAREIALAHYEVEQCQGAFEATFSKLAAGETV